MGSVAAAMAQKGYTVTGSDQNVYPPMSTFLESQGIQLIQGYSSDNIPATADSIVIGNAISRGNDEAEEALDRKLLYQSLPEVLKERFLRGKRNFVISGTHGKTTTSAMTAWLLKHAELDPSHMIGGIPANLGKGGYISPDSDFFVLEGDEYDTAFFDKRSKFLHYLPELVVVNNIEFDHADIYDSLDQIKLTFERLLKVVPRSGVALINGDDQNCLDIAKGAPCPVQTVGIGSECSIQITDIDYQQDGTEFTLGEYRFHLPMVGEFNVRNAAMAISSARFAGISDEVINAGLAEFKGIARRQQVRGEVNGVTLIDDFAHHPTAIKGVIEALRQKYPERRLVTVFEPRSNTTMRNVFQNELAEALCTSDVTIIPEILNKGKISEDEILDCEKLQDDINQNGGNCTFIDGVDAIAEHLSKNALEGDVIAILSNGGFGGLHEKVLSRL